MALRIPRVNAHRVVRLMVLEYEKIRLLGLCKSNEILGF